MGKEMWRQDSGNREGRGRERRRGGDLGTARREREKEETLCCVPACLSVGDATDMWGGGVVGPARV
jgi:hypothetical protein